MPQHDSFHFSRRQGIPGFRLVLQFLLLLSSFLLDGSFPLFAVSPSHPIEDLRPFFCLFHSGSQKLFPFDHGFPAQTCAFLFRLLYRFLGSLFRLGYSLQGFLCQVVPPPRL